MNAESIKANNRIIAEFMALKNADGTTYSNIKGGFEVGTLHFSHPMLPLNTIRVEGVDGHDDFYGKWERDWDYIMSVLDVIEKMGHGTAIEHLEGTYAVRIFDIPDIAFIRSVGNSKIEAVWLAVVEFIKLHNLRK